jgi:hypothetical protein
MNITPYDDLSEVARLGLARYDAELRSQLEPAQNGRAIALHVDTGKYVVADTLSEARREMLRLYPDPQGRILSRIIGPEMTDTLPHRLLSGGKR